MKQFFAQNRHALTTSVANYVVVSTVSHSSCACLNVTLSHSRVSGIAD